MKTALLCKAFSSEVRVQLVHCLRTPKNVSSLLLHCSLSQSALSQHLKVLRDAGIVSSNRNGKEITYHVTDPKFFSITSLLLTFHA